jgi:hypothetical protein
MEVASPFSAYGLYAYCSYPSVGNTLGSALTPMVFADNSGSIDGAVVYAAYLEVSNPGASSVSLGNDRGVFGMGSNTFTTTGTWQGNYPFVGGPIYAGGYPAFNYLHTW